jgi:hypothetical protein
MRDVVRSGRFRRVGVLSERQPVRRFDQGS